MKANKVYLVGGGPGNPGLITVKGLDVLRQADTVIYDYLVDKRILEEVKEGAELICCGELGKKRYSDGFLTSQEKISNLIVKKAREGKKVVRLKNGDPSIFSRLSQELNALIKNKIEFEVIPGVTAASAASCLSGIPLTDRRFASTCVFVTGHEDPQKGKSPLGPSTSLGVNSESFDVAQDGSPKDGELVEPRSRTIDWESLAKSGTIVLYMAVENLDRAVSELLKAGKDKNTPVAIVQDVSLITQRILTGHLKDIVKKAKNQKLRPPAIIIIGETVKLEREFNWLNKNKRILFTGLSQERFFLKGAYFHLPLIKIEPASDYTEFDNYLKTIRQFDWIAFTSRYAVQYFFERLSKAGYDSRVLRDINIAVIGDSTKNRLLDFGICADLVPDNESSEGLLDAFKKMGIKDKRIFLPRSDIADKGLTRGLKNLWAEVIASVAYRNVMPKALPDLELDSFDEIMFTSPSGVRNFIKRYGKLPVNIEVSCIGEVTKNEAKKWRLLN